MDKDFLIQLTNALYGLTLLFPKKEPLRYKMRELADEILEDLIKLSTPNFKLTEARPLSALEVLDSFFEVAKAQSWVKADNILAIQRDYAKLKDEFEKAKVDERQLSLVIEDEEGDASSSPAEFMKPAEDKKTLEGEDKPTETILFALESRTESHSLKAGSMLERQEKIMDFLKENGRVQVWQVKQILPEVTKRTLRRDFEYMLSQGLIERMGERNDTYYQVPSPVRRDEGEEENEVLFVPK